jgi:hypothetical protein
MRKKLTLAAVTATLALTGLLGMSAGQAQAGAFCSSTLLPSGGYCIHGAGHTMATWYVWSEGSAAACTVLRGGPQWNSSYLTYTICSQPGQLAVSGLYEVGAWGYPEVYNWSTFTSRFGGYFVTCANSDWC